MASLYVHIPFCRAKCAYCDFLSFKAPPPGDVSRYVGLLAREMELYRGERYSTAYIGGGTPSVLDLRDFSVLLEALGGSFDAKMLEEFTVEANPESLTGPHLELFRNSGMNRVSLGVQTFDDRALARVGRAGRSSDVARAAGKIAAAGFGNFNIDLIQGIQGREAFLRDLVRAADLEPTHMSVYILTPSPRTPLYAMIEGGSFELPDERESEELYARTGEYLSRRGFVQYEVSNYAKEGFESVHNLRYWKGVDYRGMGLGAVSTIGEERWTNARDLETYRRMIDDGLAPATETEILPPRVKAAEAIMLGLRTRWGVEKESLFSLAGNGGREGLSDFIAMLDEEGYSVPLEGRLALSGKGLFRSNTIVGELWALVGV